MLHDDVVLLVVEVAPLECTRGRGFGGEVLIFSTYDVGVFDVCFGGGRHKSISTIHHQSDLDIDIRPDIIFISYPT
jgi:hypothetical protein